MSSGDCERSEQAAAYLLGALEPSEADGYREHLEDCPGCNSLTEQLRPTLVTLTEDVPRRKAPERVVARVMDEVHAEAELLRAAGPRADRPSPRPGWRARSPRLLVGVGALVTVAVVAVAIFAGSSSGPRVIQARLSANTPGHAFVRQSATGAELVVSGVPRPPAGEIYEVWLAPTHGSPRPTNALFGVGANGDASVDVPYDLHHVKTLLVTAEPAGGSQHPTSPPILTAALASA